MILKLGLRFYVFPEMSVQKNARKSRFGILKKSVLRIRELWPLVWCWRMLPNCCGTVGTMVNFCRFALECFQAISMDRRQEGLVDLITLIAWRDAVWRYLATTKFQPTDARSAFPCFDEPTFKSTFRTTLIHRPDYTALSNMPAEVLAQAECSYAN